jgi:hypothetical protein
VPTTIWRYLRFAKWQVRPPEGTAGTPRQSRVGAKKGANKGSTTPVVELRVRCHLLGVSETHNPDLPEKKGNPAQRIAGPDSLLLVRSVLVLSRRRVKRRVEGRILRLTFTLAVGLLPRCLLTAVIYTGPRCDLRGRCTSGGQNPSDGHPCREKYGNSSALHVSPIAQCH